MADTRPTLICMDLEGVLVPEIWIAVAQKTGIEQLKLTTRDVADYDQLMQGRLAILKEHNLTIDDIQEVIATLSPLPGALEYVRWVRSKAQLIILSDTFYEFAHPLMKQLKFPTLFCHTLDIDDDRYIRHYVLRQPDAKRASINAFHSLNFRTIAIGDSYNDTTMLGAADTGILFKSPQNVIDDFPQFQVKHTFDELKALLEELL